MLAQVGAGYKDAWAVLAGAFFGAMAYGYAEPLLAPLNSGPGKITMTDVLPLPFWLIALIGAAVIITILFSLERWRPWRQDLGNDYDGVPSGSSRVEQRG